MPSARHRTQTAKPETKIGDSNSNSNPSANLNPFGVGVGVYKRVCYSRRNSMFSFIIYAFCCLLAQCSSCLVCCYCVVASSQSGRHTGRAYSFNSLARFALHATTLTYKNIKPGCLPQVVAAVVFIVVVAAVFTTVFVVFVVVVVSTLHWERFVLCSLWRFAAWTLNFINKLTA